MLPSLSIVIPTHQRQDLLRACLQSVESLAPPKTDILVVDDASPARGDLSRRRRVSSESVAFACRAVSGFAVAANTGLREARGEIVEFLNDDTEVTAGWAEPALTCFENPRVAAVAPLVLFHPATQSPAPAANCVSTAPATAITAAAWQPNVGMANRCLTSIASRAWSLAHRRRARSIDGQFCKN